MLRPRRTVDEVPLPERPLLLLDDQQRLAGEDEEVLLVGLPVVAAERLPGSSTLRLIPSCGKLCSPSRSQSAGRPSAWYQCDVARVGDEPALAAGDEPGLGLLERRLRNHVAGLFQTSERPGGRKPEEAHLPGGVVSSTTEETSPSAARDDHVGMPAGRRHQVEDVRRRELGRRSTPALLRLRTSRSALSSSCAFSGGVSQRSKPPSTSARFRAYASAAARKKRSNPAHGSASASRRLRVRGDRAELLGQHRLEERVLRREAAEDGAVPDARPPGDLVDARVEAVLGEALRRGCEQAVAVPLRVGAETGGAQIPAPAVAASAAMPRTWCARSITTKATRPARTKATLPANA